VGRKKELDDLTAAFGRTLHEKCPNHQRIGCPGRSVLRTFAEDPNSAEGNSVLAHLRNCALCVEELKGLRGLRNDQIRPRENDSE
jgi:hypothetical protein